MKYVKSIEDFKKYSFEFFDSFLDEEMSNMVVNSFLLDIGDWQSLESEMVEIIKEKGINSSDVCDYGEVILQLSDYRSLLKKFVSLLLRSEQFLSLSAFLNRIFLQRVGNVSYRSMRQEYTYKERYFDRFVEIITYCNIDSELYSPFFLAILSSEAFSPLFNYKEPLKEYLDSVAQQGVRAETSLLLDSMDKSLDNSLSLPKMIEAYIKGESTSLSFMGSALQKDVSFSLSIIDSMLSQHKDREYECVQLLLLLSSYKSAKDRLKQIYATSSDSRVRALLSKEFSSIVLTSFNSEEEFLSYVDANVSTIQDRLYGIRLARFYSAYGLSNEGINGKVMTFILNTFRNRESVEQVEYFREYFKFVDLYVLQSLASIVYDISYQRKRLLSSKWAMRLISTFASSKLLAIIFSNMADWLKDTRLVGPCQYFIDIMCSCARSEVLPYIGALYDSVESAKMRKFLDEKIKTFSMKNREDIGQVRDRIAGDFGFDKNGYRLLSLPHRQVLLKINSKGNIDVLNAKSEKPARIRQKDDAKYLRERIKFWTKKIKEQKKRLYSAYLEFRNYDRQSFEECIVHNNLLNFLSQHLFWGRYKSDRLVEICVLNSDRLVHVAGNMIGEESLDDYSIAILQSIDASDMKDRLSSVIEPLFDQFSLPFFSTDSLNLKSNCVENLSGVFCNARLFVTRLEKMRYKVADRDEQDTFSTLIKINENLNLITTVEFDRIPLKNLDKSISLGQVRFYELSRNYKRGKRYILNKQEALMLENINPYVLSNELGLIVSATKA